MILYGLRRKSAKTRPSTSAIAKPVAAALRVTVRPIPRIGRMEIAKESVDEVSHA
ncbi:hypothetical protein D9M68_962700 [compost metagenome]